MPIVVEPVARLIDEFARLPGIGPKTAQRLTYHLLRAPADQAHALADALVRVKDKVSFCSVCYNITERNPCEICSTDTRDRSLICVVEEPLDAGYSNTPVRFTLPVTKEEKKRLQATKLVVERRYHYRHVAAGLAWKAAALLPDNSPEAADVLNTAGNWLKAKHEKQADRFYQAIEKRCPKTEIGKQAVAKHWFVDDTGPWSDAEDKLLPSD